MEKNKDGSSVSAEQELKSAVDNIEKMLKDIGEQKTTMETKFVSQAESREKELREMKDQIDQMRKDNAEAYRKISLPGSEEANKKFSVVMALKAHFTGDWTDAQNEKELINETHKSMGRDLIKKDIVAGGGTTGGFLLPVIVSSEIIPLAIAETPIFSSMGIRKINNIGAGEFRLPKQTARSTAYWVGENAAPTKTSATFDTRILRAKKLAAVSFISNDMYRQGRADMEAMARQDLADAIVLALEAALMYGTGTNFTPKGLVDSTTNAANYSGFSSVTQMGTNGGQFGFTEAARMVNAIRKANLLKGNLGYLFHQDVLFGLQITRTKFYAAQTKNGQPIIPGSPLLSDEELKKALRGMNFGTSSLVPSSGAKGSGTSLAPTIFGDWSQLVLGMWSNLEVSASREATVGGINAFAEDGMFVKAVQTADITIRDEAAFCVISDCTTTSLTETQAD